MHSQGYWGNLFLWMYSLNCIFNCSKDKYFSVLSACNCTDSTTSWICLEIFFTIINRRRVLFLHATRAKDGFCLKKQHSLSDEMQSLWECGIKCQTPGSVLSKRAKWSYVHCKWVNTQMHILLLFVQVQCLYWLCGLQ